MGPLLRIATRRLWPIWSRISYQMHCLAWMRPSWLLQRISLVKSMLKHKPQFVLTIKLLLLCFRYLLHVRKSQNRNNCLSMVESSSLTPEIGNYVYTFLNWLVVNYITTFFIAGNRKIAKSSRCRCAKREG